MPDPRVEPKAEGLNFPPDAVAAAQRHVERKRELRVRCAIALDRGQHLVTVPAEYLWELLRGPGPRGPAPRKV